MNELNNNTLQAAVSRLPVYAPPADIWDDIELALDAEAIVEKAIPQLPTYTPPDAIWESIAEQLPVTPTVARRVRLWPRLAAAAVLTAVVFGTWWLLQTNPAAEQIVVTQETIDVLVLATVQENEDDAFAWIDQLCASRAPVCEQPEFRSLKSELDELTAAKQRLYAALGQYGDDPELTNQLVQIEVTRTQLLQEMMQLI
jgi:hypothetical protein